MYQTLVVITLALILSLPLILRLSLPPLKHHHPLPISPSDELHDLSLFRRATTPTTPPPPTPTTPKIAFLFLTHSPLTLSPLWHRFFSTSPSPDLFNLYVHLDPKHPPSLLSGVFSGRAIPSRPTERSSPTLISASRRLLATALLHDPANSYFALLSPSCIPLHSFPFLYSSLLPPSPSPSSTRKSFIEILDSEPTLPDRYDARGKGLMLPQIPFQDFRAGSQFFLLARNHAFDVVRDRRSLWSKFKLPCLNPDTCYPEEHFFPTLLSMEDPKGCAGFSLTRVNWTDSVDGHPRTYQPDEVSPELIHRLRERDGASSSYMFARKFSPDCLKPLMDIADDVIFRD